MAYIPSTSQQLTFDTDDGRIDSYPNVIITATGQQLVFYSKFLTTGKTSYSRITFSAPSFTINVEAGTGTINGTSLSWSAGTVTALQNSYQLVYVIHSGPGTGTIGIGANLSMNFLKDVIMLAYVSSGSSSISSIEELERSGNYIYCRKQTLVGMNWVWDDYEVLLNTGSNPMCFYNSSTGFIYLNYIKDSISYVRTFNPASELTWQYLSSTTIISGTINLNRNPENSTNSSCSSGYTSYVKLNSALYPLGVTCFSFVNGQPYVFLPRIGGSYLSYVYGSVTYNFFTLMGTTYTIEASYTIPVLNSSLYSNQYKLWTGTIGVKYVGVQLHTGLFLDVYRSDPEDYGSFELYSYPSKVTLVDPLNYSADARDNMIFGSVSSGYMTSIVKTAEYIESRDSELDLGKAGLSSGYMTSIVKTAEYIESRDSELDLGKAGLSSGYKNIITIT
jgi:hypothetical protein